MSSLFQNFSEWVVYGFILLIAFPLAIIVLSEIAQRWDGTDTGERYATPLSILRNGVLPLAFISILLRKVIELDPGSNAIRIADTAFWIVALNCVLAFMNVLIFGERSTFAGRIQIPRLLLDLVRVFFVLCGAAVIVSTIWDVNLSSLVTALGVGSVVIGLALQDTLGSLFAGIALVSARHFRVGDWIRYGKDEGQVTAMNWRSVTIKTRSGDSLVLPNGVIARQPVTVLAGGGSTMIAVEVKVPFDIPPDQVTALMAEAAMVTKDFDLSVKPLARVAAFDDSGVRYLIGVKAADPAKIFAVRSEYLANVWYLAQRNGIPFVGQFNANFQPPEGALPDEPRAPLDLAKVLVDLKSMPVGQGDLERVTKDARLERYRDGQTLVEQGKSQGSIYVIVRGRARARFTSLDGLAVDLHEFERGQVVLAKPTLRGAPMPYALSAIGELDVIALPVPAFKELCDRDTNLATDIEQILVAREEAAERALTKAMPADQANAAQSDRLQLLRDLFRGT
ncbi:MAG: hypothetical protein RL291_371 [Pseudomonadota bacterium]